MHNVAFYTVKRYSELSISEKFLNNYINRVELHWDKATYQPSECVIDLLYY